VHRRYPPGACYFISRCWSIVGLELTGLAVAIFAPIVSISSNPGEGAWLGLVMAETGLLVALADQDNLTLALFLP